MIKGWKIYVTLLLFLMAISFFAGRRSASDRIETLESNNTTLRKSMVTYKIKVDGLERTVSERNSLILTQKEALKQEQIKKEYLRKTNMEQLSEIISLKANFSLFKDSVGHNGTITQIPQNNPNTALKPAILLPFQFSDTTKYYSFKGGFDIKGKMNFELSSKIDLDITVGKDKKSGEYKAVVSTPNPFVTIGNINSTHISEKDKRFCIAVFGGYGIGISNTIKLQPMIGIGIGYTLIKF